MVRGLGNLFCIAFQSLTLISDLIIDLMAKKMSLPVRTASPAPSSAPRAISLSSSGSNWYASPCPSCAVCRRVTVFVLGPPLVETMKILRCLQRPPAMRPSTAAAVAAQSGMQQRFATQTGAMSTRPFLLTLL